MNESRTDTVALAAAVDEFEERLPGWWWSVTSCALTHDADCGPDARVLGLEHAHVSAFDNGFHEAHKGSLADALRSVMQQSLKAIAEAHLSNQVAKPGE